MGKHIIFAGIGLFLGVLFSILLILYYPISSTNYSPPMYPNIQIVRSRQVVGFLPYWLLQRASPDYSQYITTLTYFALRIDKDGGVLQLLNSQQEEPGWYNLSSGKADTFLQNARSLRITLSLTLDSSDNDAIDSFLATPATSAANLVTQTLPIMQRFGFSDLNLDIEYTKDASDSARKQFTKFIQSVKNALPKTSTLTLEISPVDVIQHRLIDVPSVATFADTIIVMAYDYHAPDSFVTGPIAPLNGAGTESEYDVASATQKTLQVVTPKKVILGIPLYGYEWEILSAIPRTPNIPGSGTIASNRRVEAFLAQCATCSAQPDEDAQESFITYQSTGTNTNHIIFYPTRESTSAKIDFAERSGLAGLALWALGYEGNTVLTPLTSFKNN